MSVVESDTRIEHYRFTAQAIGLMELLGNGYPSSEQLRIVEKIIKKLQLSSDACEDMKILMSVLKH